MDVANLEAAFERVTVTDENDDHVVSSTTTYHKTKVCIAPLLSMRSLLTSGSLLSPRLYP